MTSDVLNGVNGVLAGITLCAGLACLGIWLYDRTARGFLTMAALALAMAVQLVSGSVVIDATDRTDAMVATFARSVSFMIAAILAVHTAGQLVPRVPTRLIVRLLLLVAAVRVMLWWPTDLIVRHPLSEDGRDVFGPLGSTWVVFPLALVAVAVLLTMRTSGAVRWFVVVGIAAYLALTGLMGLVHGGVAFQEVVTLNVVPGGIGILLLASTTLLDFARGREKIARRQELVTGLSRAAVDSPVDTLRRMAERQLSRELDAPSVAIAVSERTGDEVVDADDRRVALGRRQRAELTGVDTGEVLAGPRGDYVHTVLRIVAASADRAAADTEFAHRSVHDDLTGLPTVTLLRSRLDDRLLAGSPTDVLLMVCRVGRFGRTVATDGLDRSNELLVGTARVLQQLRRPSTTVARISTDMFAVLEYLPTEDPDGYLVHRLARIRRRAEEAADGVVHVGAVVGRPGSTAESMLRDAATAVERSRAEHRTVVFDEELAAQIRTRVGLERDLTHALQRDEIEVRYQPVVDPRTRAVVGCEALARWRRDGGLTPPSVWIPLAERSGLIHRIGRHVLSIAAAEQPRLGVPVAVNVSPLELAEDRFVDDVMDAIGDCPPELITLELTEGAVMADLARSVAILQELRGRGLRVALDDFGSSYSSLGALADLPVDVLKLDRSFVDRLGSDGGRAVVQAIVALAHSLGKPIVAEGVETEAQLALLVELDVDRVQGFLVGRPVTADRVANARSRPVPHLPG